MKIKLTQTLIRDRLSVTVKPVFKPNGQMEWKQRSEIEKDKDGNPASAPFSPYIILDADQDAPTGFGVKVGKKLTFIIQRRVGDKVVKAKVGDVNDFESVDAARRRAREMALQIEDTGKNPNLVAKADRERKTAATTTVAEAFAIYRNFLVNRGRPAKDSSLRNYDLAARRLDRPGVKLLHLKLGDLKANAVVEAFDNLAKSPRPPHPNAGVITKPRKSTKKVVKKAKAGPPAGIKTATEQTFRWATVAAAFVINADGVAAAQEGRPPSMTYNPFDAIKTHERYRDRKQLEEAYKRSAARNPLAISDGSLGRFLSALWERRQVANNQTACDYLLLTLLWGTRRGEAAPLKWFDRISKAEGLSSSWVDLEKRTLFLHDTKNHSSLTLPLAPGALEILKQRRSEGKIKVPKQQQQWVFPARSSRAVQGHYLDSKAILAGLRQSAALEQLRTHDLRRTFGSVAESISSYSMVKRLLNHKSLSDPTYRYTQVEEDRVPDAMERIERAMLETAPLVALALLPLPKR